MSQPEHMVIDDLIVLGRAVPEIIKNRRITICMAGYSLTHGFIRIYPTKRDSPLRRWNIIKVPVERAIRPRYNGRPESWKIIDSRSEWRRLSRKIEVVGKYPKKKQPNLIKSLVDDCCVLDIYNSGRSLGIIKPQILDHYFEEEIDFKTSSTQLTLDGKFRIRVKDDFNIEPRIKYKCSKCRVKRGFHDHQLLEWGAYEWLRKRPDQAEQVWENLFLDNTDYAKYFLVGNMLQYPTAFMIISILRFKKFIK